jgi:hypothetical protein
MRKKLFPTEPNGKKINYFRGILKIFKPDVFTAFGQYYQLCASNTAHYVTDRPQRSTSSPAPLLALK